MERAELQRVRILGCAIGAATGPVAAFGQSWAGTGDGRVHVWFVATAFGALFGALGYPVFHSDRSELYHAPFAALFGFSVGLVAGALAAFPMGAVAGAFGGLVAGAVVALSGRRLAARRGGVVLAGALGAGAALTVAWVWLS